MLTIDDIDRSGYPAELFTQVICQQTVSMIQTIAYKYEAINEAIP
jgi:hypothetical protein